MKFSVFVLLVTVGVFGVRGIPVQIQHEDNDSSSQESNSEQNSSQESSSQGSSESPLDDQELELYKVLEILDRAINDQIARNGAEDKKKDEELCKALTSAQLQIQVIEVGCGNSNKPDNINLKKRDPEFCNILNKINLGIHEKQARHKKLNVAEDSKLSKDIRVILATFGKRTQGHNKNKKDFDELVKNLDDLIKKIKEQIACKDRPDQQKDAELLQDLKATLKIVQDIRRRRCESKSGGKDENSKEDNKSKENSDEDTQESNDTKVRRCQRLEQLENALKDKINRQGKLDEQKDRQLVIVIQITANDIRGNGKDGNDNDGNNNDLKQLAKTLDDLNNKINAQIARKDRPDQQKDAELLQDLKATLKIVQNIRRKRCASNSGRKDERCQKLEQLENSLQDKINRQGKLDEQKDRQLVIVIQITANDIRGNGKDGNGNDGNNNDLKQLAKTLDDLNNKINAQIARKDRPDQQKDAELLQDLKATLKIVQDIRRRRCESKSGGKDENSKEDNKSKENSDEDSQESNDTKVRRCQRLEQLENALKDKINRQGKLDEQKDRQLVIVIQITANDIRGNGKDGNGNDGNNNDLKQLAKTLDDLNNKINAQIARKDRPDQQKDAELLQDLKATLKIVQNIKRKRCASNSGRKDERCQKLEQLENSLQDKINRQGKLDEQKDRQLVIVIQITANDIRGNGKDGNGNDGNGNDGNNNDLKQLAKTLDDLNNKINAQIARKDRPDQQKDAELLQDLKATLKIVQDIRRRRCGSKSGGKDENSKEDNKSKENSDEDSQESNDTKVRRCQRLEQLENALKDKINRQGKLDEQKDRQLIIVIQITANDIRGNGKDGNDNDGNNNDLKQLAKTLDDLNNKINAQIARKSRPDQQKDAELLGDVKATLKIVQDIRRRRCESKSGGKDENSKEDNKSKENSDEDSQESNDTKVRRCQRLEQLENALKDKINRQGKLDEQKDRQLIIVIQITANDIRGNGKDGNDNDGNNNDLKQLAKTLDDLNNKIKAQIARKSRPDQQKDAELFQDLKATLKIVQDIRRRRCGSKSGGKDENSKEDNKSKENSDEDSQESNDTKVRRCQRLEQLENALKDKINRQGKLDEQKDRQLVIVIQITANDIRGNGKDGNGNDGNNNDLKQLAKTLDDLNNKINAQIARKSRPDQQKDAELLGDVKATLKIVQDIRRRRCESKSGGKDENSKEDNKSKENSDEDSQESNDTKVRRCQRLEQLENALKDKINRQGKLDEQKDRQLIIVIQITANDIRGNGKDGNDNDGNNNDLKQLAKTLDDLNNKIKAQIARKSRPDQQKDAELFQDLKATLKIVQDIRRRRCGSKSGGKDENSKEDNKSKENSDEDSQESNDTKVRRCQRLEQLENALKDKINRQGKLDEQKDRQLVIVIQITANDIRGNGKDGNGNDGNNNDLKQLAKTLDDLNNKINAQIARKDRPDQQKDAELLQDLKATLKIVQDIRRRRCGSKSGGKDENSKEDNKSKENSDEDSQESNDTKVRRCQRLEQLENALKDKINRQGKLDEQKDRQLVIVIQITANDIRGNGKDGNGNDGNNNDLKQLAKTLDDLNNKINAQIARKDRPDQQKDAELLGDVKATLKIVQDIRRRRCESKSGGKDENSKEDNKSKENSDEDSQESNDTKVRRCQRLEQLENALKDKINRQGKLDEQKDRQLVIVIQITANDIRGNGKDGNGNDGNNNDLKQLAKTLDDLNNKINAQIARKDRPDQQKDAELLQDLKATLKIVQNIRRKRCASNSGRKDERCQKLEQLENSLQDKINRQGKLDEQKDRQLVIVIQITANDIRGNGKDGNGNDGNGNDGNNNDLKQLAKTLDDLNNKINAQIARKDRPDQQKDAELLQDLKATLKIVQDIRRRRCGSKSGGKDENSKEDNKSKENSDEDSQESNDTKVRRCQRLEQLENALKDKINRQGKLDEQKDRQLVIVIQITANDIRGNGKDGNDNDGNNNDLKQLAKTLDDLNNKINAQIARKSRPDQQKDAELLGDVKATLKIVQNIRRKRCASNSERKDERCQKLEQLENTLQDKINRQGKADEQKDKQLVIIIQVSADVFRVNGKNGNNNGNDNDGINIDLSGLVKKL